MTCLRYNYVENKSSLITEIYIMLTRTPSSQYFLIFAKEIFLLNYSLNLILPCRVLEIMKSDALKDPAVFPDALHARALISQV